MKVTVYNQDGAQVGAVDLKPEIFGVEPNPAVVHQYVVAYLANQRQGTASAKTRAEVSGGGVKPWRQKGTGRARAGTIRSPLWRHGGIAFPPKPQEWRADIPKKMKRLAFVSALSDRAQNNAVAVIDKLEFTQPKTKSFTEMVKKLGWDGKKALFLDEGKNENATLSCRNIPNVRYMRAALANAYAVLDAEIVVFTRAGLAETEEVFG